MKNLFKLLFLFIAFSLNALDEETKRSDLSGDIELISTEGKKYKIPKKAAFNSKFVKGVLEEKKRRTELPVLIPGKFLEPLIEGLIVIDKTIGNENKKVDAVVKQVFHNVHDQDLVNLIINANRLLSPLLEKAVYRKYAMAIKKNRKKLIKLAMDKLNKNYRREIAKEYHNIYGKELQLRGPQEKWKETGFSIEELFKQGKLKERIANYIAQKKAETSDEDDMYKTDAVLDLSGLKINNLKGLEKIPKIAEAKDINLSDNKISDISALKSLTNIERLNLSNNRIKTLGENLKNLNKLVSLMLSSNALKNLDNIIANLNNKANLNVVALTGNPIKEADAKAIKERFPNIPSIYFGQANIDYPDEAQQLDDEMANQNADQVQPPADQPENQNADV